jgi:hypothetical protein
MPLLGSRGAASLTGFGGLAKLGYLLRNSLRFRASGSTTLSRAPASAGNRKTWTMSFWFKRGRLGASASAHGIMGCYAGVNNDSNNFEFRFTSSDTLNVVLWDSGAISNAVFRDPAAWYHIVLVLDTTQAGTSSGSKIKLYVNGVLQSWASDSISSGISQNADLIWNSTTTQFLGRWQASDGGNYFLDGYMAEVNFVNGQALTPSSFAKTDAVTGQWIPIKYSGTYGTNGFYLNFNDTSNTTAATLGKDSSGNGNNWTPSGFSVTADRTYDPVKDVPTLSASASNYATFNPLMTGAGVTVSQGNLFTNHNNGTSGWVSTAVTQAMPSTGKWYIEMTVVTYLNGYTGYGFYRDSATNLVGNGAATGANDANWWSHYGHVTAFYNNSAESGSAATWSSGTMMLAFDADAGGKAYFGRNGTWYNSSDPAAGTNAPFTISRSAGQNVYFIVEGYNNIQWAVNAGQQTFAHTPPTGFKALNTFNLP